MKMRRGAYFLILLSFLVALAYVVPTCVHPIPYGTDVFTHLFFTREMANVNHLSDFYERCIEEGYLRYDYLFGLWLFGAIVTKITGLKMLELSILLPFAIMVIMMILYYAYASIFGASKEESILSVAFLLSMPLMCMGILGYSPSVFVRSLLILIILLVIVNKISLWKRILLMNVIVFVLCFTHTGTYMFLFSLTLVYLFVYVLLYGDLSWSTYMTAVSVIFIYVVTLHMFPHVHPQYIDKGRILAVSYTHLTLPTTERV